MVGGKLMFGHQDEQQTLNEQAVLAQSDQNQDWTQNQNTQNDDNRQSSPATSDDDSQKDDNDQTQSVTAEIAEHAQTSAPLVSTNGEGSDLLDIKQQALSQLTPIVGHLDQTPEEKFRTTMMMIQASDDQSLIKTAYEAAQQISDEKTKAQALLDVVNEINYFTHPS